MLESSTCGSLRVIKNRSIGQVNEAVEQLRSTRVVEVKAVDSGSQTHHGVMARPTTSQGDHGLAVTSHDLWQLPDGC
ncbi:unnamed protein product [Rhodiola kirilowii]